MWAYETVFYQIYPLGFTGAPYENDGIPASRIRKVADWIPHLQKLGVGAVYLGPVFESDTHGYNTRDYNRIDTRLGTEEDFRFVCGALHKAGIRVILDGVFNHAGRGFWAFQDVLRHREQSPYLGWFHVNTGGNSPYNDGLWYEGWEGHYDLVRLNLRNPAVADHLIGAVQNWIRLYGIDGLRLDVAYLLDPAFIRRLRAETSAVKEDFFLLGEMIGGDYNRIIGDGLCHSATNYECYKGLYSSFNSLNLFEIVHSLKRQFGPEPWALYKGRHLVSFADNHDVTRVSSILAEPRHLPLLYTILFTMPGIPMLYYGSEWGAAGLKSQGDPALRPAFPEPEWNALTDHIARLAAIFRKTPALWYGDFRDLYLRNRQCVFARRCEGSEVFCAVNADAEPCVIRADFGRAEAKNLLTGEAVSLAGGLRMEPYTSMVLT